MPLILPTCISILLSFACISQAVIVFPGDGVLPKAYVGSSAAKSERELFQSSAPGELPDIQNDQGELVEDKRVQIITSSRPNLNESDAYHPGSDSFVRGAIEAWAQHQHLVIRPEEVWFTILTQMNFYMNAHGDDPDVRSVFVSHQGKENIHIEADTWRQVLAGFKFEIQKRVKTDWLLDWILPKFSTSTTNDEMTANVLMMGLMQSYFTFSGGITCGLPSVTLLGEVRDWERLAAKVERLPAFGQYMSINVSYLHSISPQALSSLLCSSVEVFYISIFGFSYFFVSSTPVHRALLGPIN
jgi:hypothetical protein